MRSFFFCLLLIPVLAQAQRPDKPWRIGARAGFTVPNLQAADEGSGGIDAGFKSLLGPFAGLELAYAFRPRWELVTQLNYSAQGGQKNGDQRLPTRNFAGLFPTPPLGTTLPDYLYTRFDQKTQINYLELPLMARYHFVQRGKWRVGAQAGLYVGYLVYAHNSTKGTDKFYLDAARTQPYVNNAVVFDDERNIMDELNRINWGVQGGGVAGYRLNKRWWLELAGGGTYGIRRLQRDTRYGNNHTGALIFSLGASFVL
jgi:hypothetical protein